MSAENVKSFARKMYFEDEFYLLACRNAKKAIQSFGPSAFTDQEAQKITDFAADQVSKTGAAIDQLGGGGILDLSNGGCGVWC